MEINWAVTLIISAFLAIPVGIITNIMTPYFQKRFDKLSRSSRGKSLIRITKDYERIKMYQENPSSLQIDINILILDGIFIICMLVICLVLSFYVGILYNNFKLEIDTIAGSFPITQILLIMVSLFWVVLSLIAGYISNRLIDLKFDCHRLKQFNKYESETLIRIKDLETNIENREHRSGAK